MIPQAFDTRAWTALYKQMQADGVISQPYVVLKPVEEKLEVIAQNASLNGLTEQLRQLGDAKKGAYLLWTKTAREKFVQEHGRGPSPRLASDKDYYQIEVDL
jgi:hypothetical protein